MRLDQIKIGKIYIDTKETNILYKYYRALEVNIDQEYIKFWNLKTKRESFFSLLYKNFIEYKDILTIIKEKYCK